MNETLLTRLREHRTLRGLPEHELEWLTRHGELRVLEAGQPLLPPDNAVDELIILLSGMIAVYVDRGAGPRRSMEREGGDVTGLLPYSRLTHSPGRPLVERTSEMLVVHRRHFPELVRECETLTRRLVQEMLDRARAFTQQDLHDERILSLGRLAAGLAHELDNPASAVSRAGRVLEALVREADAAAVALGNAGASPEETTAAEALRDRCLSTPVLEVRSPLEQARREEAICDWLEERGLRTDTVEILAETPVTLELLDELEQALRPEVLRPALRWLAASCAVRTIVGEIGDAASRISELVRSVKKFTHMDEAAAPRAVDVAQGLAETLTMLRSKAKAKSARVSVHAGADLPRVVAVGGELNQVWSNLIENALDAVGPGGSVEVSAAVEGESLVVRVLDDGPGIPPEHRERIFEPFFTTKAVGQGTGLGLDIVRGLLGRQGGRIEFSSVPGRTEFRVSLPVEAPAPALAGAAGGGRA